MNISVIILAAGEGSRMRSTLPKVLHTLGGKSLLAHVLDAAHSASASDIHVVYGHGGDIVPNSFENEGISWIRQTEQLGTGHAVSQAMPNIDDNSCSLILYGDVPLITVETINRIITAAKDGFSLLTVTLEEPTGYGRIVRDDDGKVLKIIEQKDASQREQEICEVNTGIMAVNTGQLKQWLAKLDNNNSQAEYYLTDVIEMAVAEGVEINTVQPEFIEEVVGVNSKKQLHDLERVYQAILADTLLDNGLELKDASRFDVRGSLTHGNDCLIDINVVIEGNVRLGDKVYIGPNCIVKESTIGDEVTILANSVIDNAIIGSGSKVGPFARLRPDTELMKNTHIGNFVEIKKSTIGEGSKVNHLSYVGDADIGRNVNIGAGVITCNYDGAYKHKTIIEDDVFVGSDTQLIAPVKISKGATIGAGATITKDVVKDVLVFSRAPQKVITGWKRPSKNNKG